MIKLRPYQENLVSRLERHIANHTSALGVLVTGGGKSNILGATVLRQVETGRRVLVVAHKDVLIEQLSATLAKWGIKHRVIANKKIVKRCAMANPSRVVWDARAPVTVSMSGTVINRLDEIGHVDVIGFDEAHHVTNGNTWGKIRNNWPGAVAFGLTATPIRTDKTPVFGNGAIFQEMEQGPPGYELVAQGYLAEIVKYCPSIGSVKFKDEKDAEENGEKYLVGDPLKLYREYLDGKKMIVFGHTVELAERFCKIFNDANIPAAHIDCDTDPIERTRVLDKFRSGELKILTNYQIFTEGFDVPDCAGVMMARITTSYSLYAQMAGRAGRMSSDKAHGILIDMGGNTHRLARGNLDPYRRTDWSILAKGDTKTCPRCDMSLSPTDDKKCTHCGLDLKRSRYCYNHDMLHGDHMCETRVRHRSEHNCEVCGFELVKLTPRDVADELGWVDGDLTQLPDSVKGYFESLVADSRKPPKRSGLKVANNTNAKHYAEKMERAKIIDDYVRQINGDLIKLKPNNYTLFKMFYDVLGDKNQYHLRCMIKSDDELDQALRMATEVHLEWLHGKTIQ